MSAVTSDQLWTGEVETAKVSFNAHEVSHGVTKLSSIEVLQLGWWGQSK
jgi:hypothetical protein